MNKISFPEIDLITETEITFCYLSNSIKTVPLSRSDDKSNENSSCRPTHTIRLLFIIRHLSRFRRGNPSSFRISFSEKSMVSNWSCKKITHDTSMLRSDPVAQSGERPTAEPTRSESPVRVASRARYLLLAGMACDQWQRSRYRPEKVGERGGPCPALKGTSNVRL